METQKAKKKTDRLFILESMPVSKAVVTLAVPTIIANIIQFVYNLTDTFFIGKLSNSFMVAAIGLCMPVTMVLQSFGNMFSIGGASLISRYLGAGRKEDAKHVSATSFWSALSISCVIAVISCLFTREIVLMAGADQDTVGYAKDYLLMLMIGAPFIAMQMALNGILRSEGASNISMRGMITGSVINIILDPIFIFLFGWGIMGAAVATTIGNICGFAMNLSYFVGKNSKSVLSVSPKMVKLHWEYFSDILKIGVPASLGMFLMSFAQILSNRVAGSFGSNLIAANNIVMRVTTIAMMFTMGLTQGSQPLMGFSYGAKKYRRLNETIRFTIFSGTLMNIVFALVLWFAAGFWIRVFINIEDIITLGAKIVRVMCFSMPFMAIQMTLMTAYQALGKSVAALVVSLGRQGIFFIPALYIFSSLWGVDGYIWAGPFANIFTAVVSVFIFLFIRKSFPASADDPLQALSPQFAERNPVISEKPVVDSGTDL
ncbi:MAG: MATE family efflux transporter [Eubacteriaceae bacterium]|nr:MATE family efflux transporter [Eubacteriaceae bacterium]